MHIIQDFLKISNHSISRVFLMYFSIVSALCIGFMLGRISNIESSIPGMTITSSDDVSISSADDFNVKNDTSTTTDSQSYQKYQNKQIKLTDKSLIFGSIKGKYFYYKGCGGANISTKNLVYYKSEADAIGRGKVIYAKCK